MLKSSLEMIGQKKTQSHNYGFAESLDRYRSGKMCGRFTLTVDAHQIREAFPWITLDHDIQPRFNIAPSQPIAVVANDGLKTIDYYQWGLIPSWAKDASIGYKMINARGETVEQKPSFRNAFRRRRCLILADGFYEWSKETGSKSKQPIFIKMQDEKPFAFAGLWEFWQSPDGSDIRSCTIITTEPNELVKQYHNRMPVILTEFDYDLWLQTGETDQEQLKNLLKPYNPEKMEAYAVSKVVNNPANDTRECILPL